MAMKLDDLKGIGNSNAYGAMVRNIRCPHCGKMGAFHGLHIHDLGWSTKNDKGGERFRAGVRICPNTECQSIILVLFAIQENSNLTYPFEVIDFDPTGIPEEIVRSFKEALTCHSTGCYRAAALMVRRVLEEICDHQGAGGDNLKTRIVALGRKIIIPKELVDAADELRLLGNDAAHIESREYGSIGAKEVEISVMFVKEILKATYQYASLLTQLRSLRKE